MVNIVEFNYDQPIIRRKNLDQKVARFNWPYHKIATQYQEPYGHATVSGNNNSQSFIAKTETRPIRTFELTMDGLRISEPEDADRYDQLLSFNSIYEFYEQHGLHKAFIYDHPVYGDLTVRFTKPISIPKKLKNGGGVVESFTITLIEVIDTHYVFTENENFEGVFPFPCLYYDVEVESKEDTVPAPLGSNYVMVFKRSKKPLKTFKVYVDGLRYFQNFKEEILTGISIQENMATLEFFYLAHRLGKAFTFTYLGVDYSVRFKEPISIPLVVGTEGLLNTVELMLVETPFETLTSAFTEEFSQPFTGWIPLNVQFIADFVFRRNVYTQNNRIRFNSFANVKLRDESVMLYLESGDSNGLLTVLKAFFNENIVSFRRNELEATFIGRTNTGGERFATYASVLNSLKMNYLINASWAVDALDSIVLSLPPSPEDLETYEANKQKVIL